MEKSHASRLRRFCLMMALTALCLGSRADDLKKFFRPEQIEKANTGRKTEFFSSVEKETLTLINLARLYPKQFLKLYMDYAGARAVSGNTYYTSLTKELKVMEPCNELLPDKRMFESAKCWATEAGQEGIVGHMRKTCSASFNGECCSYGSGTAIGIVMQLLIDEGVESLGHRRICLDQGYKLIGISVQPHKTYGTNAVLDFTYGRSENFYSKASAQKQKSKKAAAKLKASKKAMVKKKTVKTHAASGITTKKKTVKAHSSSGIAAKKNTAKKTVKKSVTAKNKSKQKASAKSQLAKN
jgi:hypothetical protein